MQGAIAEDEGQGRKFPLTSTSRRGARTYAHPLDGAYVHRTYTTTPSRLPRWGEGIVRGTRYKLYVPLMVTHYARNAGAISSE